MIALDVAPGMARRTAATVAALGLENVTICQASADTIPLAGRSVDCVLVNGLFNLAPRKDQVLAELARVTRPGGRLVAAETVLTQPLGAGEVSSLDDWFR